MLGAVSLVRLQDIHAYRPIKHSISHSQILLRNYTYEEAYVPMREMVESLMLELLQIKGYEPYSCFILAMQMIWCALLEVLKSLNSTLIHYDIDDGGN